MQFCTADVKSKSKVVGQATYKKYDSVAEAVQDQSEEKILDLINSQTKTNAMNLTRAGAVGMPTKEQIRVMAMSKITSEEFAAASGDMVRLGELVKKYSDQIVKEYEARLPKEDDDDNE
jgi:hypothetical protein